MSGKFDAMATGKISIVKKETEIDRSRGNESGGEEKTNVQAFTGRKIGFLMDTQQCT